MKTPWGTATESLLALLLFAPLLPGSRAQEAGEWRQWRGPQRDGTAPECRWTHDWPREGPRKVWTAHVGMVPPDAPSVLVSHNVDTLIWQRYAEAETNPLKRWYIRGQWRKWHRFERRAFAAFHHAWSL